VTTTATSQHQAINGPTKYGHGGKCMPTAAARARCYVRVSDKELNPENQRYELEALAARLGLEIEHVYTDVVSGAKAGRAGLERALADAEASDYDVLLIYALDRLSREGIARMLAYLERLKAAGVRLLSAKEPWLDTAGPLADLLVAIFAWVAQQERTRLRERVITGMERARREGKRIGRPTRVVDIVAIARLRAEGRTWRSISMALKTPARTLWRAHRAATVGAAIAGQLAP
jgi:putative DNA-invertase from lambdoid prophage Rac